MRPGLSALIVLAAGSATMPAHASCSQGRAIYHTPISRTELAFVTPEDAAAKTHEVDVRLGALESRAYINPSADLNQPVMTLPYQCPEDDLTEADLDACILYRGVVYALSAGETLRTLPDADKAAATQILLPNFSASLYGNPVLDAIEADGKQGDIFTLSGCGDE
ncbi:hypothetical protein B7H23_05275 [Notoacmeibacter marinus]|uniref:DUF1254 domain-containing protein n=1 Tax=Notoacmeibacter marinus TaxID=1876515 RepID=A0A231V2G5_9HYPH|nr:hypothetical protein [Notoacmeibacter marinus]OXT02317.1 hypothetical protein B7H23_05275 [Notoacmeibacter marinus]